MNKAITIAGILLISCQSPKVKVIPKSDTILTVALYIFKKEPKVDAIYRRVCDTLKFVVADSVTARKVWVKDSLYWIPQNDTVRDEKGKPVFDSTGKVKMKTNWYPYPKELILIDAGKSVDSALKRNTIKK